MSLNVDTIKITPQILAIIAEIDEFKGAWKALGTLAPERLSALRRVATIESIGSSTRIEGSKLSDSEVDRLLSNIEIQQFETRDEQEVAGYAEAIETVFASADAITLSENHIKQLHRDLLRHSAKDERHRGEYKTGNNHVSAFDPDGKLAFAEPLSYNRESGYRTAKTTFPFKVLAGISTQKCEMVGDPGIVLGMDFEGCRGLIIKRFSPPYFLVIQESTESPFKSTELGILTP